MVSTDSAIVINERVFFKKKRVKSPIANESCSNSWCTETSAMTSCFPCHFFKQRTTLNTVFRIHIWPWDFPLVRAINYFEKSCCMIHSIIAVKSAPTCDKEVTYTQICHQHNHPTPPEILHRTALLLVYIEQRTCAIRYIYIYT